MPSSEICIPFAPGEHPGNFPASDDPRLLPWFDELRAKGVVSGPELRVLKPNAKLHRGLSAEGYLFKMVWSEPVANHDGPIVVQVDVAAAEREVLKYLTQP